MKNFLVNNAKSILKETLIVDLEEIKENREQFNSKLIEDLQKLQCPSVVLKDVSIEEIIKERSLLSKTNYHFPEIIKVADLKNYHYTPSKILDGEIFDSNIPMFIPTKESGIGFFLNHKYKDRINYIMEEIGLKMILSVPDGLAKVVLIDKSGSGQNFPKLVTLHEKFLNGKVLSEDNEIEAELESLRHNMAAITQSIAANGFESIEDYNKHTDEVPQQYTFIFVSGFPTGFNKKSSENLLSLIEAGSRAGIFVYLTISVDPAHGLNQHLNGGMTLEQFIKTLTVFDITNRPHEYITKGWVRENAEVIKIPLQKEKELVNFFNNTYKIVFPKENENFMIDSIKELNNNIEHLDLRPVVDIDKAIPSEFWTKKAGKGISVPFGKNGIQNVYFSLGVNQFDEDETTHHGLICGATGSGKTVFIHDLILQIAMNYSPKEIQFYLLDYKEGTEFAIYKDFPYVNILSMESEIEFGLEVLDHAIELMSKRAVLFKEQGVANLDLYNSKVSEENILPRIIIIIDEFQVLLPKDPKITAKTNERLDKILRLGRSFGINLLLATQTLKGIDLDPAILSNMPLRIALRMDEKDTTKIFGEGNHAPKFLKNPGEGIYNKAYGNSRNNINFQAFKSIGNTVERIITNMNNFISSQLYPNQIDEIIESRFVYNGTEAASFSKNETINEYLSGAIDTVPGIYIGEAVGLTKDHEYLSFNQEFADNLIIIGSDQQKAASLFLYMIIQQLLIEDSSKLYLLNYSNNFEVILREEITNSLENFEQYNQKIVMKGNKESEQILNEIVSILDERKKQSDESEGFINFENIYFYNFFIESSKIFNSNGLRDVNIEKIQRIIKDGPELGIHFIIYASDFSTLTSNNLGGDMSKFKKKIAFHGGNSLKLFGIDSSIKLENGEHSSHVAIVTNGRIAAEPKKFKPYIYDIFTNKNQED
jgi:hypothetical protein